MSELQSVGIVQAPNTRVISVCVQIVGITTSSLVVDSTDAVKQQQNAAALKQELEWAMHLGFQACILPLPPRLANANFARLINQVSMT